MILQLLLIINKVDIIIFNVDAFSHPFYIKTEFSSGDGDQATKGTLPGTLGIQDGKLSWNKMGLSAWKYYYDCSPHTPFDLGGSIIVE